MSEIDTNEQLIICPKKRNEFTLSSMGNFVAYPLIELMKCDEVCPGPGRQTLKVFGFELFPVKTCGKNDAMPNPLDPDNPLTVI